MKWEVVIGLEVHTQLSTQSKIFSGSAITFGAAPNTQASAVDIALPGVLPVLNQGAVERAIKLGLAIHATINRRSLFARKNYFYPDLPKGYQISQFERPIVEWGSLSILVGEVEKTIRITRAHLEEDAGKSLHEDFHGMTGIDLNRAGTPLLEIVSEPDLRSATEAVAYAKALHSLVTYIDICDGNMQEGSFRMDANVSVRPMGTPTLGTRCEIKNLNSFKFLEKAIEYEVQRQIELIEEGGKVVQETRLYDAERNETRSMRSKEDAHDYRYFPDPDLPPLVLDEALIDRIAASMPELPEAKKNRFIEQYHLTPYDAIMLTADQACADYFETAVQQGASAKLVANWIMGEIATYLNRTEQAFADIPLSALRLAQLIQRIEDNTISNKIARDVFEAMWSTTESADQIIAAKGLKQITDTSAIETMIDQVLQANPILVADVKSGKEKAFNALVGQAMKISQGKANPAQVNAILRQKLS
jgi:aspartyl-tRNA(Asn)/glutamyl-tRNA(Gln) amidotransferase subunit B